MNPKTKLFLLHVAAAFIGTILALVVFTLVMKQFEKKTEVPPKKKKPDAKRDRVPEVEPDEEDEPIRDSPGDSPGEDEAQYQTEYRETFRENTPEKEVVKVKNGKVKPMGDNIKWHDSRETNQ